MRPTLAPRWPRFGARAFLPLIGLGVLACSSDSKTASSAFNFPIDFSYACEGDGKTVAPTNDETANKIDATRMCPDVGGAQGDMFGVVLDRQPPQLMVLQVNPASGGRRIIDVDYFVPGVTGITVGRTPIRVLRAPDWSAFYVISAGDQRVDRVVIGGYDGTDLTYTLESFALPGTPIEAALIGDDLIVASRDTAELWVFDVAANPTAPALSTVAVPDRVAAIEDSAGNWLVTFRTRKTVALLGSDGATLAEGGLVPQCRDGLDNDGDGTVDRADLDCLDMNDDDEGATTGAERVASPSPGPGFAGAAACANGVDDDDDGATDFPEDLGCADAASNGELLTQCNDGVDQDQDGLTDLADDSCYSAAGKVEGQVPADGPFHPTFIDGGEYGRFVYVLDERVGEIAVFATDSATLTRVDINAADGNPPDLEAVEFSDFGTPAEERFAVPAVRPPAYRRQGIKNIQLLESNASSLSSGRLRGELWDRIIAVADGEASVSLTPNSAEWKPEYCAPTPTDRCVQPAFDDATWFAFGVNLQGGIQLVEAIRRGTAMHALAQRVVDPSLRTHKVSAPRLTRRGALINARGEPEAGLPFIGAALEEVLVERVEDESPDRLRRFGVWPPADFEEAPSETWIITYQGKLPGANGLGQLDGVTSEGSPSGLRSTFTDAAAKYCELGIEPGDLLQLEVPVTSADPTLLHTVPVIAGEVTCPTRLPETQLVEVTISAVGMSTLTIDPASAVARPLLPVLDEAAIEAQRLSLRACREALDTLDETLGLPENLTPLAPLTAAQLPSVTRYAVRGGAWVFVGSRSGFLHRNRWDRTTNTCSVDETLDPRLTGRTIEVPDAVSKYETCPPLPAQLLEDTVTAIAPEANRFVNPSFGLDIFPACEVLADGTIAPLPSQQDTAFTFAVTGPNQASALSVSDSIAGVRVPLLDFRRQQVQLDTAAKRASILQLRLGDPEVVIVFD